MLSSVPSERRLLLPAASQRIVKLHQRKQFILLGRS